MASHASFKVLFTAAMMIGLSLNVAVAESCSCLSDAVAAISADPWGAAFCSQYVSTIWDSTTITTPVATTIITETVPALITITTTVLEVGSTTTTLTETISIPYESTSTAVVTSPTTVCYTGTAYGVQQAPAKVTPAPRALDERQLLPIVTPSLYLPPPPSIISIENSLVASACECFLGPSATVTRTVTDFVGSGTLSATVDFTTIPTSTAYISLVTTWTDVVVTTASVVTGTTTVTSTSYTPVPTYTNLGLNWYYYTSPYSYETTLPPVNPQYFNNPNYNFSGYIENVGDFHTGATYSTTNADYTCNIPAGADCEYVGIIFQGYLWAANGPGTYTLSSGPADNAFFLWHGTDAYVDYTYSNYDYQARYPQLSGIVAIQVGIGELVPVTMLWLNGGGPGNALLSITNPAGKTYTDTTGFFVPANASCPGYIDPFSP